MGYSPWDHKELDKTERLSTLVVEGVKRTLRIKKRSFLNHDSLPSLSWGPQRYSISVFISTCGTKLIIIHSY